MSSAGIASSVAGSSFRHQGVRIPQVLMALVCAARAVVSIAGRPHMLYRSSIGTIALMAALCVTTVDVQAWDDAKSPDLKGQWVRVSPFRLDPQESDPPQPARRGRQAT